MSQINRRLTIRYLKKTTRKNMAYTIREAYKKIVISYLEIKTNNQKPSD